MSDTGSPPRVYNEPENDELGYEFTVLLVSPNKDEQEAKQFRLTNVTTFTAMNKFFDLFDEEIAIPNQEVIKYEVGSDGLVVILVERETLVEEVEKFINRGWA